MSEIGSIASNAARVLQQRMSVAPRKRQLATKVRRVVKGHKATSASFIRSPRIESVISDMAFEQSRKHLRRADLVFEGLRQNASRNLKKSGSDT